MDDFDFLYTDASPREYARQPFIPPPEPFRPPIPYKKGLKLTIHRHIPSMPFGGRHVGHRDSVPKDALLTATAVDQCLAYPPLEGETCLEEPSRTLEIVGELRVGDEARAQVVLCHLDDDDKEQIVVGKIYDPLYYSRRDEDFPFIVPDITYEADHDYLLEAAAYTELEDSQLGGTMIPTYYGSWTFNIDVKLPTETKTRPVRMILMEHIRGPCMKHMDPEKLSQEQKLEIVARVFEANSRITSAGVQQNDNEERNVVVQVGDVEGGLKSAIERVVVLDFNIAVIPRLSKATVPHSFELPEDDSDVEQDEPEEYTSTLPESPVDFGWGAWAIFEDWLPDDWMDPSKDRAMRLYRTWLLETWGNSEQFARPERCFQDIEENEEYLRGKGIRWEYDQVPRAKAAGRLAIKPTDGSKNDVDAEYFDDNGDKATDSSDTDIELHQQPQTLGASSMVVTRYGRVSRPPARWAYVTQQPQLQTEEAAESLDDDMGKVTARQPQTLGASSVVVTRYGRVSSPPVRWVPQ